MNKRNFKIKLSRCSKNGRFLQGVQEIPSGECVFTEQNFGYILFNENACIQCKVLCDFDKILQCKICKLNFCSQKCHNRLNCVDMKDIEMISEKTDIDYHLVCLVYLILENIRECDAQKKSGTFKHRFCKTLLKCKVYKDSKINECIQSLLNSTKLSVGDVKRHQCLLVKSLQTNVNEFQPTIMHKLKIASKLIQEQIYSNCQFENDFILSIFCVIFTNSHSILRFSENGIENLGNGLFPISSFLLHSCDPNCIFVFKGKLNEKICIRSIKKIKSGEPLTISYISEYLPLEFRRKQLLSTKHFFCDCRRCKFNINDDFLTGYKCANSNGCDGYITKKGGKWICCKCHLNFKNTSILDGKMSKTLNDAIKFKLLGKCKDALESLEVILKSSPQLHINNYYLFKTFELLVELTKDKNTKIKFLKRMAENLGNISYGNLKLFRALKLIQLIELIGTNKSKTAEFRKQTLSILQSCTGKDHMLYVKLKNQY